MIRSPDRAAPYSPFALFLGNLPVAVCEFIKIFAQSAANFLKTLIGLLRIFKNSRSRSFGFSKKRTTGAGNYQERSASPPPLKCPAHKESSRFSDGDFPGCVVFHEKYPDQEPRIFKKPRSRSCEFSKNLDPVAEDFQKFPIAQLRIFKKAWSRV
jgi:hypothetical protein